jgi:hypothetical protein
MCDMEFRDERLRRLFDVWDKSTRDDDDPSKGMLAAEIVTFLTVMLWVNIEIAPPEVQRELRRLVMEALRTDPYFLAKKFNVDIDWQAKERFH